MNRFLSRDVRCLTLSPALEIVADLAILPLPPCGEGDEDNLPRTVDLPGAADEQITSIAFLISTRF